MSAARPVYGNVVVDDSRPRTIGNLLNLLPVLSLFLALAGATVWFVALPALQAKPVAAKRSCEIVVLASGAPDCVRDPRTARTEQPKR